MKNIRERFAIKNAADPRDAAYYVLGCCAEEGIQSDILIAEALELCEGFTDKDRRFFLRLVNGTLERLVYLDAVLDGVSSKAVNRLKPSVRNILRIALFQILFMDRVPDRAACSEALLMADMHGLACFKPYINGVLRKLAREKDSPQTARFDFDEDYIKYSVPQWLYDKLCRDFGPDRAAKTAVSWLAEKKPLLRFVLVNGDESVIADSLQRDGAEISRVDMEDYLKMNRISVPDGPLPVIYRLDSPGAVPIDRLKAYTDGLVYVQDTASALTVSYAGIKGDDTVTDVCASPGGKSLFAAETIAAAGGRGHVDARDLSRGKKELIDQNIKRLRLKNISASVKNALDDDEESYYRSDVLFADLPCSGLGIVSGKPDIKLSLKPFSIEELSQLQKDILRNVSRFVKPGGKLVYSTCTVTLEENENNVQWMNEELGFDILLQERIWPEDGQDGFFISVLRKRY